MADIFRKMPDGDGLWLATLVWRLLAWQFEYLATLDNIVAVKFNLNLMRGERRTEVRLADSTLRSGEPATW